MTRQQHPQRGADRHARCGREVVADGDAEPPGQRGPEAAPQHHAVPGDRGRSARRTRHGDGPPPGRDTDEDEHRAREEQRQPPALLASTVQRRRVLQQGLGEVGAPDHDRVGHGAEEHQVDDEPVRGRETSPEGRDQERGREPERRRVVTQRPRTTPAGTAGLACGSGMLRLAGVQERGHGESVPHGRRRPGQPRRLRRSDQASGPRSR